MRTKLRKGRRSVSERCLTSPKQRLQQTEDSFSHFSSTVNISEEYCSQLPNISWNCASKSEFADLSVTSASAATSNCDTFVDDTSVCQATVNCSSDLALTVDSDHSYCQLETSLSEIDVALNETVANYASRVPAVDELGDSKLLSDVDLPRISSDSGIYSRDETAEKFEVSDALSDTMAISIDEVGSQDFEEDFTAVSAELNTVLLQNDVWMLDNVVSEPSVEILSGMDNASNVDLECQCGAQSVSFGNPVVICQKCHSRQHASCVKYDLTDPLRGTYLCPHCHVVEVIEEVVQ
jgi:hypothetical protein